MQEKIYLRPLCLSDINKKYLFWVNDPLVTEYLEIGKQRLAHSDLVRYVEQKNSSCGFDAMQYSSNDCMRELK